MSPIADTTLHYLVMDVQDGKPVHVFLGNDPMTAVGGGPRAELVHLELLPFHARFGRPGRPTSGRPVLGQARNSPNRFREFPCAEDLWEAGFLPVAAYRVCDDWSDYHDPWATPPAADYTAQASADESL